MGDALRVLVVDDDEADRLLFRRALARSGLDAVIEEAGCIADAVRRIAAGPALDCVLVDLHLPDGSPEALVRVPARSFAVLVVTGLDRESLDSLALLQEAEGSLTKDEVNATTIAGAVRAAIARRRGEA